MKSMNLEKSDSTASSYRAMVEKMSADGYWPQFRWLKWFFDQTGEPESTRVAIFDSVKARLTKRVFVGSKEDGGAEEDLASALGHHRLDVATRIVVFVHDGRGRVDRCTLDTVCAAYDVDPLFVMSHFYWDHETQPVGNEGTSVIAQVGPPDVCPPISLPSLVDFLSLDYRGQFSGLLLPDISPPTGTAMAHLYMYIRVCVNCGIVLILVSERLWHVEGSHDKVHEVQSYCYGRPSETPEITRCHVSLQPLVHLDSSSILQADHNIIEYLHPYAQFLATVFGSRISRLEREAQSYYRKYPNKIKENEPDEVLQVLEKLEPIVTNFGRLRTSLDRSYHHLSQFTEKYPKSHKMSSLLHDYEAIAKHAEEFERDTHLNIQVWLGLTQVVEEHRETRQGRRERKPRYLKDLLFLYSFSPHWVSLRLSLR